MAKRNLLRDRGNQNLGDFSQSQAHPPAIDTYQARLSRSQHPDPATAANTHLSKPMNIGLFADNIDDDTFAFARKVLDGERVGGWGANHQERNPGKKENPALSLRFNPILIETEFQ
jgi:hypothetical protein